MLFYRTVLLAYISMVMCVQYFKPVTHMAGLEIFVHHFCTLLLNGHHHHCNDVCYKVTSKTFCQFLYPRILYTFFSTNYILANIITAWIMFTHNVFLMNEVLYLYTTLKLEGGGWGGWQMASIRHIVYLTCLK